VTPTTEMQARVAALLDAPQLARGWVIDGNYSRMLDSKLDEVATDIICTFVLHLLT
jgi:hypothetical protein